MSDEASAADLADEACCEPAAIPAEMPGRDELADLGKEVLRRLDEIAALFQARQHKDEQIDRLYAELQAYRNGDNERRQDGLLLGLIRLYDGIGGAVAAFRDLPPEELTAEKVLKRFSGVEEDIELLLENHEVMPFREETVFLVPQRQRVSKIEITEDETRAGTIAARLRPGFLHRERVLEKERVAVYALPRIAV